MSNFTEKELEEPARQARLLAASSHKGIVDIDAQFDAPSRVQACPEPLRANQSQRDFASQRLAQLPTSGDPKSQSLLPPLVMSGQSPVPRSRELVPPNLEDQPQAFLAVLDDAGYGETSGVKQVKMKVLNQLAGYSQNQKGWFGLEVLAQTAGAGVGTNMLVTALGIAALGGSTMGWGLVAGVVILLVSAYFGCSPSTIFSHVTSYPRQRNHRLYADQGIDDQIKYLVRLSQDYYTSTQHTVKKLVESVCSRYTLMKGVSSSMSLFKSDASSILLRKLKAFKALDEFTSSQQDDLLAAILDYLKDPKNQGKALFTAIVLAAKELQASPSPQSAASPAF